MVGNTVPVKPAEVIANFGERTRPVALNILLKPSLIYKSFCLQNVNIKKKYAVNTSYEKKCGDRIIWYCARLKI